MEEKYIRTFEGDMETLKKGGKPDLVPLVQTSPEQAVPPPVATVSSQTQTEPQLVELPQPALAPELPPIPQPPAVQPPPVPKPSPVAPLKTYESDFLDHVKETHASTATVIAAEQDSERHVSQTQPEHSRKNLFYGIAGVSLIIAGGAAAYVSYSRYVSSHAPAIIAPAVFSPIFVDERVQVSGTEDVLSQAIRQSIASPLPDGSVRLLYLENATSTDIFSSLREPAPNVLLRNIVATSGMTGIVNVDGTQSPFFIISVTSFGDTFAGMLAWEPLLPRDLAEFFPTFENEGTKIASSTTATSTQPAHTPGFRDEVITNHDVRVYRDAANRIVLLYGYWNQTTLVIARDADAFTEILGRLATSRAQN